MFWQNISALAFKDPLHACLYGETKTQGKTSMLAHAEEEDGFTHLRQRGMSAPDSWLNFRCTLSSCLVRISSWGMIAAELSLSKLSLRLLNAKTKCTYLGSQCCVLFCCFSEWLCKYWRTQEETVTKTHLSFHCPYRDMVSLSLLVPARSSWPWFNDTGSELVHAHGTSLPSIQEI